MFGKLLPQRIPEEKLAPADCLLDSLACSFKQSIICSADDVEVSLSFQINCFILFMVVKTVVSSASAVKSTSHSNDHVK